ncbi:hypothetical protein NIES2104_27830 [Leptolyngbya sp. NIES-2104]|nr:hypothetical protein NIES2104_27830 [Leptolyngbya sp. NIES-2104]
MELQYYQQYWHFKAIGRRDEARKSIQQFVESFASIDRKITNLATIAVRVHCLIDRAFQANLHFTRLQILNKFFNGNVSLPKNVAQGSHGYVFLVQRNNTSQFNCFLCFSFSNSHLLFQDYMAPLLANLLKSQPL